jgi:type 2 lantibiotic biosynthesis protein LanM
MLSLLQEYPVLARVITEEVDSMMSFVSEMLHRLCDDWDEVQAKLFPEAAPGACVDIRFGAGDRHHGGKVVSIFSFGNGSKVVYKPRSLAADVLFSELLDQLASSGLRLPLRVPRVVPRGTYGWTEFISHKPCSGEQALRDFYTRAGELLAIIYCLHGSDLHYENLMATEGDLVLLDLECLFSEFARQPEAGQRSILSRAYAETVLLPGLLPSRPVGGADGTELSGLSVLQNKATPFETIVWENLGTDELKIGRRRAEMPESHNSPFAAGSGPTPVAYIDMVLSGWEAGVTALNSVRDRLLSSSLWNELIELPFRYVPVHSYQYSVIFRESCHPNVLRDGMDRDAIFDELWKVTPASSIQANLVRSARNDLWAGDIPIFQTRPVSMDVWDSRKNCFKRTKNEPVVWAAEKKLRTTTIDAKHTWVIKHSINNAYSRSAMVFDCASVLDLRSQLDEGTPLEHICSLLAERIGEYVLNLSYRDSGQLFFADTLELTSPRKKQHFTGIQDIAVYDGLSGMLLFFHYLARVTGRIDFSEAARDILLTIEEAFEAGALINTGLGGFCNTASALYSLAHVDEPLPAVGRLLESIEQSLPHDTQFDLLGGSAGTVCAALSYYLAFGDEGALSLALLAGDRLFEGAIETECGTGWKSLENSVPLTGFAHGASGVAYALSRLAHASKRSIYDDLAKQAIQYERSAFSAQLMNWRDLRDWVAQPDAACWCYGAPGIGLARLAQHALGFSDEATEREISIAFHKTRQTNLPGHILCHGALGNWEFLDLAAKAFQNEQWKEIAESFFRQRITQICTRGIVFDSPGETLNLMLGLAGVGYALLRRSHPQQVPSVLLLEPPIRTRVHECVPLSKGVI